MILKRFVKGISEEAIFQKRAPEKRPDWIDVAELKYASGTSAKEAVIHDAAGLVWAVNLGCVDLNPHPVRADDLDHPDELRVDLDPMPGVDWRQIVDVALVAREVLDDHGLTAWPKTSGSRGFHIYARIEPTLAVQAGAARRRDHRPRGRAPRARTSRPRGGGRRSAAGVFVDFNQNAKDRTVASAYSVRAAARRAGVDAARCGTRSPTAVPKTSPSRRCPRASPTSATRGRASTTRRRSSTRCWTSPTSSGPPRRRREGRRAKRSAKRRASSMPLIEIARTKTKDEAMAALDTWRANVSGEVAEKLEPVDVLVDGMRGPELDLVPHPDQPAARAGGPAAAAGGAARRLQPVGELLGRAVPPTAGLRAPKTVLSKVLPGAPQCLRSEA